MKDKIGFIAIGQAGGNIGRLLQEKDYSVLFINTSQEDLDTLTSAKHKHHIKGGEGCNKDRNKAKKLTFDNYESINKDISEKLNKDIYFVVFSSGGGTGSGIGPMLIDLLNEGGKTAGAITILPGQTESLKSHMNSYECFCELTEIPIIASTFILDNNHNADKLKLNTTFVNMFTRFLDIPTKIKSEKGNIDKAEMVETLSSRGMSIVSSLNEANNTASLITSFTQNIFAPMEKDRIIKYITLASSDKTLITDLEKAVGTPIDTFRTYTDQSTICLLSGLSYPQTRLDIIRKKVMDNKEVITNNLTAPSKQRMKNDINFMDDIFASPKRGSINDTMSKYLKK
ncbi:MAG: hypothetical protein K0R00_3195 [Herbinix sp.]|nr:hypothetical protein [Herbinix sp.]